MERDAFLRLATTDVAARVRAQRPGLTCGFPLNGSRRWYALYRHAHPTTAAGSDPFADYIATTISQQIHVHRMLYAHGVDTIVYPLFGGELMTRGDEYYRRLLGALEHVATHPALRAFYEELDLRVGVYGNHADVLHRLGYSRLLDQYAELTAATASGRGGRLLYGLWADDATDFCAAYAVEFFQRAGRVPTRTELVASYYGMPLDWLTLYIGFEKPYVFDTPLLLGPETALYFTRAPSLGLSERAFRAILYDLLFARSVPDPDALHYGQSLADLAAHYARRGDAVAGAGAIHPTLGLWTEAGAGEP